MTLQPLTSVHVDIFISLHTQQGIVRLLRQSDAQLFAGWAAHPSINDVKILETIDCLANKAAMLLQVSRTYSGVPRHANMVTSKTSSSVEW